MNTPTHESTDTLRAAPQGPSTVQPPASVPASAGRSGNIADDVTRAVLTHWRLVALIAAAATLLAWLLAAIQPKRYRATSIAAVAPLTEQLSRSEIIHGVDTLERRVVIASVTALAAAPVTRAQARASDDYEIAAFVLPNTNLFRVEVEGSNPTEAAAIANRLPLILGTMARNMYKVYGVTLLSAASVPRHSVLPRVERAVAAGLAFGLLLGIAVAYILHRRRFA